jgi:acyl-CoA synthetase (NDP forming)
MATDACIHLGLKLAELSEPTAAELRSFLPAAASVANPVDMIASATPENYERSLAAVLADEAIDSVLVIFIPPLATHTEEVAAAVRRAAATRADKTVVGIFMSAKGAAPQIAPIPSYQFPEAAAVALARAAEYGAWRAQPLSTVPQFEDVDRDRLRAIVDQAIERGGGWLTPAESQAMLGGLGIGVAAQEVVTSEDDAVRVAGRLGYPVVIKAVGARIVHKTELRAVIVGVKDEAGVRAAWKDLAGRLGDMMTGVLVQELVTGGVEMLVGVVEDPTFGPVIACATGGTSAELFADGQFRLHPLTEADARDMIDGLRGAPLLRGYRGATPADEGALANALLRLSALVGWCPEIQELDINPLLVLAHGARAVDARIRVDRPKVPVGRKRVTY